MGRTKAITKTVETVALKGAELTAKAKDLKKNVKEFANKSLKEIKEFISGGKFKKEKFDKDKALKDYKKKEKKKFSYAGKENKMKTQEAMEKEAAAARGVEDKGGSSMAMEYREGLGLSPVQKHKFTRGQTEFDRMRTGAGGAGAGDIDKAVKTGKDISLEDAGLRVKKKGGLVGIDLGYETSGEKPKNKNTRSYRGYGKARQG